jgi:hypothetical protein
MSRKTGLVIIALLLAGSSCKSDSTGPNAVSVLQYLTGVRTSDGSATAVLKTGASPTGGSGPAVTVRFLGTIIIGGTSIATVTSSQPFSHVIATVDGVTGFYELVLPAATTSATILVSIAQNPPTTSFVTKVAAANGAGPIGSYTPVPVNAKTVGTGDVQVNVSWDAASDVDLHVVEPGGREVWWGNRITSNGGQLDLDSNAECAIDNVNQENITWPTGRAPTGTYTIRLDYFLSCNVSATNWVVTVNVAGQPTKIFTGRFVGLGDRGGSGSGILLGTFTR